MIKKVINICGTAGSGKDTFGDILQKKLEEENYKVMRINYGDYLKFLCKNLFGWDGKKDEKGRDLLQYIGTDIVRKREPNFWIASVVNVAALFDEEFDYVICSDCRFPNENDYWKEKSFESLIIKVIRPDLNSKLTIQQKLHVSENALSNYEYDATIINKTIDGLEETAREIIKDFIVNKG